MMHVLLSKNNVPVVIPLEIYPTNPRLRASLSIPPSQVDLSYFSDPNKEHYSGTYIRG